MALDAREADWDSCQLFFVVGFKLTFKNVIALWFWQTVFPRCCCCFAFKKEICLFFFFFNLPKRNNSTKMSILARSTGINISPSVQGDPRTAVVPWGGTFLYTCACCPLISIRGEEVLWGAASVPTMSEKPLCHPKLSAQNHTKHSVPTPRIQVEFPGFWTSV